MGRIKVEESLLVGAPPEKVYKVLVEPAHHKRILPDAFVKYEAESDEIVSFSVKSGKVVRDFRVRVEQTEPNKIMREIELSTNIVTEFRLEPHEQGTVVTIATDYATAKSISGFIESLVVPAFLRILYKEELIKLGRYVLLDIK